MITLKKELHPRNKHLNPYDFPQLITVCPDLVPFVILNKDGKETIDFSNPVAVKTLNQAILKFFYHINWDLPSNYLCPPIPGRADYIHYIADLLGSTHGNVIPLGNQIKLLDIGVGANCIYPLIGQSEYGWHFVGTDINAEAVKLAKETIKHNSLEEKIEIRLQPSPCHIFKGILKDKNEYFSLTMCNPPFHSSASQAQMGTQRKWKNLNVKTNALNFGGQSNELWCPGGEVAFIIRMIEESKDVNCPWFTTLVSKADHLPKIYQALNRHQTKQIKTIDMSQGQKKSRLIAWSFK